MRVDRATLVDLARRLQASLDELWLAAGAVRPDSGIALSTLAQRMLSERCRRDSCFPPGLFGEPAWELLLALYVASDKGEDITMRGAAKAAQLPYATGARLVERMEAAGLITRQVVTGSRTKRVIVALTDDAADRLSHYLASLI